MHHQREVPPDAEWWDRPLLPNGTYNDLERGIERLNLRGNSVIDHLVQHPIPILPPGDKNKVAPKPLMLTKKVVSSRACQDLRLKDRLGSQETEETNASG
jgi:hypothetical protein